MIILRISSRCRLEISPLTVKLYASTLLKVGFPWAANWDVGLTLTNNDDIRRLNRNFLGKDKPTDVLSFPVHQFERPGEMPKLLTPAHTLLGDMYISVDYVNEYCRARDMPVADHLQRLLAHGLCHLVGYTHDGDDDHEIMLAKEDTMLRDLKKALAAFEYDSEFVKRRAAQRRQQQSGASLLDRARREAGLLPSKKRG